MIPNKHIFLIVLSILLAVFLLNADYQTAKDSTLEASTLENLPSKNQTLNLTSTSQTTSLPDIQNPVNIRNKATIQKRIKFRSVDEIRASGYITAVKLKWETKNRLPRSGTNSLYHHHLLESFAKQADLEIRWLTVKNIEEMFTAIEQFKADVIPRHLTITDARLKRANFTYPIATDNEVVIAKQDMKKVSIDDDVTVFLPIGSSYIETVKEQLPHWKISKISHALSSDDLADKIVAGEINYSILDRSEFNALSKYRKDIKVVLTLPKRIQLAWAVHKDNHQLIHRLNEVISYYHATEITEPTRTVDFPEMNKSKLPLRIITRNSPETYFLWKGELLGFEYELMKKFSKVYKTKIEVIVADTYQEMLEMLQNGEGDVIAAGLTRTAERIKDYQHQDLMSTIRYNRVDEVLVAHKNSNNTKQLEDLKDRTITVRKSSSFWKTAQELTKKYGAKLIEADEMSATEILIAQVDEQAIDLTIADSNLVTIEKNFRNDIVTPLILNENVPYSYIIRKNNPKLLEHLNQFIRVHYRTTFYNVVKNRYFHPKQFNKDLIENRLITGSTLSPYDNFVQSNARIYNFDWRLIVSQMYQESKFNPKAKSYAGALGLMQVLPRTGKELGITNLKDPEQSIIAGVRYLDWTRDRFSKSLPIQEQVLFSLASYNAGFGHVKDAQRLARQLGLRDDKWFHNVEKAMLLLQKRHYYQHARFGYVRGSEPVKYVYDIHQRYLAYVQSTSR